MEYDIILIRYGEMTLKKKNYKQFLLAMNDNIKKRCAGFKKLQFVSMEYRFYIYLNGENYQEIINILNKISGINSYSLCKKTESNYDEIASVAIKLLNETLKGTTKSFKVETHRGNKNFPATSIQISQEIARRVLPSVIGLSVDVHNPEIVLGIDFRVEASYIFLNSFKGLGGYPSGIAGDGLLMISGGLDSPIAGFLSIKKGVKVKAIHFFSPPYTSLNALQKVVDLLQILSEYASTGEICLYVIPFTKIQDQIKNKAKPDYLITLMRRAMYKIADMICKNEEINIIINGESIGQVASQTLESIRVVNEVTNIPIIRPLATFDKEEIITIARRINTYETSIKPYEDCCTVFVPDHPVIKPLLKKAIFEEEKCELQILLQEAINDMKIIKLNYKNKYSVFN